MIVTVDKMKELLGLPEGEDPAIDLILENSSKLAQTLVEAYLGFSLEYDPGSTPITDLRYQLKGARVIRLKKYPAHLATDTPKIDGVLVPPDQYTFASREGVLEFKSQRYYCMDKLETRYRTGFKEEDMPPELVMIIGNMAMSVYEGGGKISSSGSGQLKSMTMFDAMSMSFETGGGSGSANAGTPEGLVGQWSFLLDKYNVDKYAMGGLT